MKKYKVEGNVSGWATVSCSYDDLDDDERDEYLEDIDCGDYDYSAGNSGASLYKDFEVEIKVADDIEPDTDKFESEVRDAVYPDIDRGNLDILDGETDIEIEKVTLIS